MICGILHNELFAVVILGSPASIVTFSSVHVCFGLSCHAFVLEQFLNISISQGSVVTHSRRGEIFRGYFVANLPLSVPVKGE